MFTYMRWLPYAVALVVLAGCAAMVGKVGPDVPAPTYRVGDRWVYQARDGFRLQYQWVETHEVTAVGPVGISVHVSQKGDGIDNVRDEQWVSPGQVGVGALNDAETRRFASPLQRFNFPLTRGQVWNQWVDNFNDTAKTQGAINRYVVVGGWEKVTTPAGIFDAVQLRVLMQLEDDEFWRWPTKCSYLVWYAPAVRAVVRELREAGYVEKTGPDVSTVWTQHGVLELSAFLPGA